jgi:hypothetical protein
MPKQRRRPSAHCVEARGSSLPREPPPCMFLPVQILWKREAPLPPEMGVRGGARIRPHLYAQRIFWITALRGDFVTPLHFYSKTDRNGLLVLALGN